jgi:hypothetical protein
MAQATLTRILEDLSTLERDELQRVQQAVEARLASNTKEDTEEGFVQALLQAGLIAQIKRPDRSQQREHRLVPIQGKPLSETIIEDRR